MTHRDEPTPVGLLVLARLLTGGETGAEFSEIKKDVGPLLEHRWAGAALTALLEEALAQLEAAGLATRTTVKNTDRSVLTPAGRGAILAFLRLDALPPKATWATIKKGSLLLGAMGLPAPNSEERKQFAKAEGFKAALLKDRHKLTTGAYPTLAQASVALAWKLLGVDSTKPFTKEAVLTELYNRRLGEHRQGTSKKAIERLIAQTVNARRNGVAELRLAVVRDWVDHGSGHVAPPSAPASAVPSAPFDLKAFAERAVSAARSSRSGWFGDDKVFIAHAWRSAQGGPGFENMEIETFKRRLAEANQARYLDLVRADLVEAMDPRDVQESEVRFLGATFHFVRT